MNLNEFTRLVINNLKSYIDDYSPDYDYNDLSESQLEAVRNQIRTSITETQEIYDSNGFTNVIRTNIASVLTDLAGSADIDLPNNFIIEFADKLQQISDDQITQYYLSGGLGEDAPTTQATEATQAEPVVDMQTRMQEVIDNSESVVEKDVRLAIDEIAKQEDVTSRAALLADVKVENSLILGENKKVVIAIANTDEQVDNTISKFIDTYAKENDMVVEVITYEDVNSKHLEGARQGSHGEVDIRYNLNQEAVESNTSTHYFPKSNEDMQKLLSDYLTDKETNIVYRSETQRTQRLYPGGPLITTNQTGHQGFNVHLRKNVRYNEIESILDKSKIKAVMVAGNKSGGTAGDMSPVFKGGIGKYFKKLARKAEGERFQAIANKPGYTLGYVYVAPNGTEHIVSFVHSDVGAYRVHANDIDYSRDWKKQIYKLTSLLFTLQS